MARETASVAVADRGQDAGEMLPTGEPTSALQIRAINYVLVQVNDLRKAEQFYQDFFAMRLLGRVRRAPDGTLVPLPRDYSWDRALQTGELADTLPLERTIDPRRAAGRAWRAPGSGCAGDRVAGCRFAHLRHDQRRGLDAAADGAALRIASFTFRDPFNVNWEIAVVGSVPLIPV